ncbi:hypothetical protein ACWEH1_01005 [Micromonospora chersina]
MTRSPWTQTDGVAEQHIVSQEVAEEGAVALTHYDWDEVDGHLVEKPQFEALSGDGASGDRDDAVAGQRLRMSDRGGDTVCHEGERCSGCASGTSGCRGTTGRRTPSVMARRLPARTDGGM